MNFERGAQPGKLTTSSFRFRARDNSLRKVDSLLKGKSLVIGPLASQHRLVLPDFDDPMFCRECFEVPDYTGLSEPISASCSTCKPPLIMVVMAKSRGSPARDPANAGTHRVKNRVAPGISLVSNHARLIGSGLTHRTRSAVRWLQPGRRMTGSD